MTNLSDQSKDYLKSYLDSNEVDKEKILGLLLSSSKKGFFDEFKSIFSLDTDMIDRVWRYVRNNLWKAPTTRDKKTFMFDEFESYFFNYLLVEGGVVVPGVALDKCFPSPHVYRKTIDSLLRRELVVKMSFSTNEVFFILSFDFYHEVFG